MNSKLFARIAAVAVGASMLSSFAFADAAAPTIADNTLSFMNGEENIISVPDGAEYVSMMSYLISAEEKTAWETNQTIPTPVDTNIIALDQVKAADVATQLKTVNILADKLNTTMPAAIVRIGNSLGTGGNTWVVALNANGDGYTITFIAGLGTLTGDNTVTSTDGTVTAISEVPTTDKTGIKFKHWATKSEAGAYTKFDFTTDTVSADTSLYAVYEMEVGDVNIDGTVSKEDALNLYSYASISNATLKKKKKATLNEAGYMVGTKYTTASNTQYEIGDVKIGDGVTKDDALNLYSYASISNATLKKKKKATLNEAGYMVGTNVDIVSSISE